MEERIGDVFQRLTSDERGKMSGGTRAPRRPAEYKAYPQAPRFALSRPATTEGPGVWAAMASRRSVRHFMPVALREPDLSQLLWAAQGVTLTSGDRALRTAPSGGAAYPIETYVVIHLVEGVAQGLYHYGVLGHALEQLRASDLRAEVAAACLDQASAAQAAIVFAWTSVFDRARARYRERAYRYVYLEAGHIAQNVAVAAVSLGLGSCQIGALYDGEVHALLGVDGDSERIVYMTVVGRPA